MGEKRWFVILWNHHVSEWQVEGCFDTLEKAQEVQRRTHGVITIEV
jgi:hypothetical protein